MLNTNIIITLGEKTLELIKQKSKNRGKTIEKYIEFLIFKDVSKINNEDTLESMFDAENNINLSSLDLNDFDDVFK